MSSDAFINALNAELEALDGLHAQDPETGAGLKSNKGVLGNYTTKLFGAPYQFLDSVDKRFPAINKNVGSEYLRNFLLHSPILYIKPGIPKYTGGDDPTSILREVQNVYADDHMSFGSSLLRALLEKFVFDKGQKLQRRMFGLRPTYTEYMMYVNYMCRSMAILMGLTSTDTGYPNGTFLNDMTFKTFEHVRWENYRMVGNSYVPSSLEHLKDIANATPLGATGKTISAGASFFNPLGDDFLNSDVAYKRMSDAWEKAMNTDIKDVIANRIQTLMFMVEPVAFTENLSNQTDQSFIESAIDGITGSIGSEIAFITGSQADTGIVGGLTEFLGSSIGSASLNLAKLVEPATGGFVTNLFSGALQSIKGQKMIYPDIYKSSNSTMDYDYAVTLTTPYGNPYNYYMDIIVPLMHLICLAAPRMVTSNTVASPFLVQTYIPGMVTCQMGIISNMTIIKNPNYKNVTVNGFPSTVRVTFQVKELYNAMSISPSHDPASFLFNECLNDYMANLAGLIPSIDTFARQRASAFQNMKEYFFGDGAEVGAAIGDYLSDKITDIFTRRTT